MNVVMFSANLLAVYGAIVLGGGLVIGLFLERAWGRRRRRQPPPVAPELLEQRVRLLELEAEQTSAGGATRSM